MYRKYDKIQNKGFRLYDFKETGLVVEEKLDGANASFSYDEHANKLRVFSRNQELTEENNLNGFYQYAHDKFGDVSSLMKGYIYYGEWLTPHKVKYKDEFLRKFYLFDIYSLEEECFLKPTSVEFIAGAMDIEQPEVFKVYTPEDLQEIKEVVVLDEIKTLVGKSNKTIKPDIGEGIVIKSLEGKKGAYDEYYKLVTDAFKESKGVPKVKPSKTDTYIVDYAITPTRLEKLIYKKIDEGFLKEEDLTLENFNKVMGAVAKDFQEDIFEEEMDTLIKQMRKQIGKRIPNILRPFLENKDRENSDL